MIDLKKLSFLKLTATGKGETLSVISPILINGEGVLGVYRGFSDGIILTTHRMIIINIQGFGGKKKEFTSFPYSEIQSFSVVSSGGLELESMVELCLLGHGSVSLEFSSPTTFSEVSKIISEKIL
jgi:hypothetical protein